MRADDKRSRAQTAKVAAAATVKPTLGLAPKPIKASESLARDIVDSSCRNDLPAGTRLPIEARDAGPHRPRAQHAARGAATPRDARRHPHPPGHRGGSGGAAAAFGRLAEILTLILHFHGASLLDVVGAREEMEALTVSARCGNSGPESSPTSSARSRPARAPRDRRVPAGIAPLPRHHQRRRQRPGDQGPERGIAGDHSRHDRRRRLHVEHRRRVAFAPRILDAVRPERQAAGEAMRAHVRESGAYWQKTRGASRATRAVDDPTTPGGRLNVAGAWLPVAVDRRAAVDDERLAREIARIVRQQECNGVAIRRAGPCAQGECARAAVRAREPGVELLLHHARPDPARRDGVDAHAMRCPFHGEGARERLDAGFAAA